LIEKEKIGGKELLDIISQVNPDLVPEGAAEKVAKIIERSSTALVDTVKPDTVPTVAPATMAESTE
jgi:hypothetical protein